MKKDEVSVAAYNIFVKSSLKHMLGPVTSHQFPAILENINYRIQSSFEHDWTDLVVSCDAPLIAQSV
jgi:hypothetical protein